MIWLVVLPVVVLALHAFVRYPHSTYANDAERINDARETERMQGHAAAGIVFTPTYGRTL